MGHAACYDPARPMQLTTRKYAPNCTANTHFFSEGASHGRK
jgi:hypothetical protein